MKLTDRLPQWTAAVLGLRSCSGAAVQMMDRRLLESLDAALQPFGMVSDLSRIIAQFARLPIWDATCPDVKSGALLLDADGVSVHYRDTDTDAGPSISTPIGGVLTDCTIAAFPSPSPSALPALSQLTGRTVLRCARGRSGWIALPIRCLQALHCPRQTHQTRRSAH